MRSCLRLLACLPFALLLCPLLHAARAPKVHTVTLGAVRKVPYTPPEATPDNKDDDSRTLRVRALFVDEKQREWTVGELHDVTDRSFVIRRALRINDALPGEGQHWTWQPGPWLLVDRLAARVTALHLPAFDAQVSDAVWFRDEAAYCGILTTARGGLVAVVAQLGARKAVVQKVISPWPVPTAPHPVCTAARWQRMPMRVTLGVTGAAPLTFDLLGTTSLVEDNDNSEE